MKITAKILTLSAVLSLVTLLGGCGQKGPLVLPEKPPAINDNNNDNTNKAA